MVAKLDRLTGVVLPQNHRMIALARSLGFTVTYDPRVSLVEQARSMILARNDYGVIATFSTPSR